jgi:hypothetical protein
MFKPSLQDRSAVVLGDLGYFNKQIVCDRQFSKFLAPDWNFLRSFDAQADVVSFRPKDGDRDVTVNDDAFVGFA